MCFNVKVMSGCYIIPNAFQAYALYQDTENIGVRRQVSYTANSKKEEPSPT